MASRILPPYPCRSPKVAEVLLVPHLRGLSTGALRPALETLLGEGPLWDFVGDEHRAADGSMRYA